MEKDYFKDRPNESRCFSAVKLGDEAYICLKKMQPYAKKIEDLTLVTICRKLTRENHPRGIKVEGMDNNGNLVVGRIVYLVYNGKLLTKYGLKERSEVNN